MAESFNFRPMVSLPDELSGVQGIWLCVERNMVLMQVSGGRPKLPEGGHPRDFGLYSDHEHFLGLLDGVPVWAAGFDAPVTSDDFQAQNLFSLSAQLDTGTWALAGRAVQIVEWHRTHQFCGRCGERTELAQGERARKCPSCGLLNFPRLAPAIITLIERGEEALLARGRNFGNPMYSTLAGFVEPGESIEEAVHREVREEVGVEVTNLRYFGSQPWPFPHSLMIGFHADWAAGEIAIDGNEIADAKWFHADDLPNIPGRISISRWLIDDWLRRQGRA